MTFRNHTVAAMFCSPANTLDTTADHPNFAASESTARADSSITRAGHEHRLRRISKSVQR